MHFGRVENLEGISFDFPNDSPRTEKFLALPREAKTQTFIGCPIWSSRKWVGKLYPPGTKTADYLSSYSEVFSTVEVNSTFYHLLDRSRIAQWKEQTTPSFRFCPKVFRGITEDLSSYQLRPLILKFCDSISGFEDRLGLVFAQFAETFSPHQMPLLKKFLDVWPTEIPLAIELRHPQWFQNHALLDEIVNLFYRHRVATVITDTAGRQDALHFSLTQPKVLIRFQGNEGHPSEDKRLSAWSNRIQKWTQSSLEEIYFFTHQPEDENIPDTAFKAIEAILGEDKTLPLKPKFVPPQNTQLELI